MIRGYENKFCNKKCQSEYCCGDKHPSWYTDRSKLKDQNKTIRWSKKMCEWRDAIYQRDDYTCQLCKTRSSKGNAAVLNAHHIKGFAKNKTLRTNINNGVTLCESCHKKTYWKEKQFEDLFLKIINGKHGPRWSSSKCGGEWYAGEWCKECHAKCGLEGGKK